MIVRTWEHSISSDRKSRAIVTDTTTDTPTIAADRQQQADSLDWIR